MNGFNGGDFHGEFLCLRAMIERRRGRLEAARSQSERMNRKAGLKRGSGHCRLNAAAGMVAVEENPMKDEGRPRRWLPLWLFWSLVTIVMWGTWGLVSKIASDGVDAYTNQLLFTVGIAPLLVFVAWKVSRGVPGEKREQRGRGVFWAFLTGILGGVGNMAYFEAMVKGGKASVVTPVTALFPMVTVLLALLFLKERLGRVQWIGLGLAFVAIYLLNA
jgi:transporter family protein